jgi:hypothetical protein
MGTHSGAGEGSICGVMHYMKQRMQSFARSTPMAGRTDRPDCECVFVCWVAGEGWVVSGLQGGDAGNPEQQYHDVIGDNLGAWARASLCR